MPHHFFSTVQEVSEMKNIYYTKSVALLLQITGKRIRVKINGEVSSYSLFKALKSLARRETKKVSSRVYHQKGSNTTQMAFFFSHLFKSPIWPFLHEMASLLQSFISVTHMIHFFSDKSWLSLPILCTVSGANYSLVIFCFFTRMRGHQIGAKPHKRW